MRFGFGQWNVEVLQNAESCSCELLSTSVDFNCSFKCSCAPRSDEVLLEIAIFIAKGPLFRISDCVDRSEGDGGTDCEAAISPLLNRIGR